MCSNTRVAEEGWKPLPPRSRHCFIISEKSCRLGRSEGLSLLKPAFSFSHTVMMNVLAALRQRRACLTSCLQLGCGASGETLLNTNITPAKATLILLMFPSNGRRTTERRCFGPLVFTRDTCGLVPCTHSALHASALSV